MTPVSSAARRPTSGAETAAWLLAAAGLGASLLGWLANPPHFHLAWIAATATFWAWPLGSISLLLIHRLTGGAWGYALHPALRAGAATTWLLPFALVPVLLGLPTYPWTDPHVPLANRLWLNAPFWCARLGVYLLLWLILAVVTRRRGAGAVAPALGLLALLFSFTFASIDVVLSLAPRFNSSVFGLIQGVAALLFALAIAAVSAAFTAPRAALADIGKLLLALTVGWAYLDFMQFLIVWESDLPDEAAWYAPRLYGLWGAVFAGLALLHFLLPMALLLSPRVQHSRGAIAAIAALLIGMGVVRGWWLVLPQSPGGIGWIAPAATLGLGGLGAGWMLRAMRAADV